MIKSGHSKGRMLTTKQERFVQELVKGKNQREAYRIAYPASKKWKDNSVDREASVMMKNPKVSQRYEELLKKTEEKVTYDAAEVKNIIISTMLSIVRADVEDDEVDGKTVRKKSWDRYGNTIYDHYDKVEASKLLVSLMGIESATQDEGIHIHLHSSEEYDG